MKAMRVLGGLVRRRKVDARREPAQETAKAIKVYDMPQRVDQPGAAAVKDMEVAIWRPPVMLDAEGRSVPGVSKALIARYLVQTTAALAEADLGPVLVEWRAQVGRFVETSFTIQAWGQSVEIVHPVAPVSQELANTLEVYIGGMARKVQELHKGHQRFTEANRLLGVAVKRLEQLRDSRTPQFSDAEYLFLSAAVRQAQVMSALVPVSEVESEEVVGTEMRVE